MLKNCEEVAFLLSLHNFPFPFCKIKSLLICFVFLIFFHQK
uniref:Uncharacterized protein n=1 Tax=Rhizophora mucronata TaxID=61149 RepID=A0A2P2P2X6_RHIMU